MDGVTMMPEPVAAVIEGVIRNRRGSKLEEGDTFITTDQAEAYAAAKVREALAWQPIETAPRDGRQILLTNGQSVAQGWWEHEEPYIREKRDIGGFYIGQDESDGFDDWLDCEGGMQLAPTHWMPLPPPPNNA